MRHHLATVRSVYGRAPHYPQVYELLRAALEGGHQRLADLTITLNEALAGWLGLRPRFLRSSSLAVSGGRQDRLITICRGLDATTYLSGPAARAYIDPGAFTDAGLTLRYIVYDYPPYERGGLPFIPRLSILDPLAWLGPAATRELLAGRCALESAPC